jgi:hypothetical protein
MASWHVNHKEHLKMGMVCFVTAQQCMIDVDGDIVHAGSGA